jgi:hypothetical protein
MKSQFSFLVKAASKIILFLTLAAVFTSSFFLNFQKLEALPQTRKLSFERLTKLQRSNLVKFEAVVVKKFPVVTVKDLKGNSYSLQDIGIRSVNSQARKHIKFRKLRLCLSDNCQGQLRSSIDPAQLTIGQTINISGRIIDPMTILGSFVDNLFPEYMISGQIETAMSEPKTNSFGISTRFFYLREAQGNRFSRRVLIRMCIANCNMINVKQTQFEMAQILPGAFVEILGVRPSRRVFDAEHIKVVKAGGVITPTPISTAIPSRTPILVQTPQVTPTQSLIPTRSPIPSASPGLPTASPQPSASPSPRPVTIAPPSPSPSPVVTAPPTAVVNPTGDFTSILAAQLGAEGTSVVTGASGAALIAVSNDNKRAIITMSYKDLSSRETMKHIHGPASPGQNAGVLFDFGSVQPITSDDQSVAYVWEIAPVGNLSAQDIATAIKAGRTYLNIHTERYPQGEIRGQFTPLN